LQGSVVAGFGRLLGLVASEVGVMPGPVPGPGPASVPGPGRSVGVVSSPSAWNRWRSAWCRLRRHARSRRRGHACRRRPSAAPPRQPLCLPAAPALLPSRPASPLHTPAPAVPPAPAVLPATAGWAAPPAHQPHWPVLAGQPGEPSAKIESRRQACASREDIAGNPDKFGSRSGRQIDIS